MVLGWKNGSREDLDEVMAHAGRHLGRQWAQGRPAKEIWTESLPHTPALLVVPAPSGIARRLRGRLVAARLADAVASGIAEQWAQREQATLWDEPPAGNAPASMPSREALPAPLVLSADLLRRRGGGAHQAGRSSRQRRGNRTAAPRLLAPVSGLPVLLVDDVVTTGATLGACARAMQEAGGRVQGALTLSAAPPPAHACVTVPVRTVTATPTVIRGLIRDAAHAKGRREQPRMVYLMWHNAQAISDVDKDSRPSPRRSARGPSRGDRR